MNMQKLIYFIRKTSVAIVFIILLIELIAYQMLLKDKKRWIIIIYSLVANILSFGCGFLIFKLL